MSNATALLRETAVRRQNANVVPSSSTSVSSSSLKSPELPAPAIVSEPSRKRKVEEIAAVAAAQPGLLFELCPVPGESLYMRRLRDYFPSSAHHPVEKLVVFNFIVDLGWLLGEEFRQLTYFDNHCRNIDVIGHEMGGEQSLEFQLDAITQIERHAALRRQPHVQVHDITMPPYGSAHTKMIIAQYGGDSPGVRILISTANLIELDWTMRAQANFAWDFPITATEQTPATGFGSDLISYMGHERLQHIPAVRELQQLFRRVDWSICPVELLASVPFDRRR